MLTTKQVRNIMHAHGAKQYGIYTNKTTGHTGNERRVKCYYSGNRALLAALRAAAGKENVTLTAGSHWRAWSGITVKCLLA